jgi:hypothetical protein
MPEVGDLPGRSGIVALFDDCMRRDSHPMRELPVILLLGPRGSGKTWALEYLRKRCDRSVAIPHAFIDCADGRRDAVWQLVCDVADELHRRWKEFGRLDFPRVTLGRLAVESPISPEDPDSAQDELRERLRRGVGLRQRSLTVGNTVIDIAQALDHSLGEAKLVGRAIKLVGASRFSVEALFRTGLDWYGSRAGHNRGGLAELVKLNHLFHRDGYRYEAERTIVEAFLADVGSAFSGRRRRFNCAVLLDNCDNEAGRGLLNALADVRASNTVSDPLVVVASSRTLPELSGLCDRWNLPWASPETGRRYMPNSDSASYDSWTSGSGNFRTPESWWLPVYLRDLMVAELGRAVPQDRCRFVHRLTHGHPWSTKMLLRSIADNAVAEPIRIVLDQLAPSEEYLLASLSHQQRRNLVRWSAARDIDFAAGAGISLRGADAATDLADRLEKRLWLVKGSPHRGPRLHPWLRCILLWRLAEGRPDEWHHIHNVLRNHALNCGWDLDAAYHSLACGDIAAAVDYLSTQFHKLDAEHWIREFNEVTAAPRRLSSPESPGDHYDELLRDRSQADRGDGLRNILWSMVAARWIWVDPLGDPTFTLTDTIANGFIRLADVANSGLVKYHREAQAYRERGRNDPLRAR